MVGEMPKTYIESMYSAEGSPEPKVELGWGRDSEHVQIATVIADYENRLEYLHHQLTSEACPVDLGVLGGDQLEKLIEYLASPGEHGVYVQLSRSGINRLVTDLRRARDAAYGADA